MQLSLLALIIGYGLDMLFGDPHWLYHPVRAIGSLIHHAEIIIRKIFPKGKKGELIGGFFLVFIVLSFSSVVPFFLLYFAGKVSPVMRLLLQSLMCYQILAVKSLKDESMKVYDALKKGTLSDGRKAVSMIVGRDTENLDEAGVIKAAVETIAENTADGVIAPMFYIAIGGAILGFAYKAVNTMDSMVGYKNDTYLYFGRAAAKLDDVCNWLPARISALLMIAASACLRLNTKGAFMIFRRDRYRHESPNSAQTEAVAAGALSVQLAGNAVYFGKLHEKPTIGDDIKSIECEDIKRMNRLLYMTALLGIVTMGSAAFTVFYMLNINAAYPFIFA